MNGRPPAQSDIARFFRVTPPTVHQMILTLEKAGLISRRPAAARAIAVLVDPAKLPDLAPGYGQPEINEDSGFEVWGVIAKSIRML